MNRFWGAVFSFGLLLTLVSCAAVQDVERLRGQLNTYQSHASSEARELRANLRKVQDQLQGVERKTKQAQEAVDEVRRQLVQVEAEQGTAAAGYTAQVHALIQALVQGYQAEVESSRQHLQQVEQAAKGLEQLNTLTTVKPSEGHGVSPALSSVTR